MALPLIDKDDILEALFESLGCRDRDQRQRLSRASDEKAPARLRAISSSLVEVFCDCPLETAVARFAARDRHPGHLDRQRSPQEIERGLTELRATYRGSLDVAEQTIRVDTTVPLDVDDVTARVRSALHRAAGT